MDIRLCLRADHDLVLNLARGLTAGSQQRRPALFAELRDLLSRHRRAEAVVVYPALRSLCLPDSQMPGTSAHEQETCDHLVAALATHDIPSKKWRAMAQLLLNLLTLHAREQHRLMVPVLSHRLSPDAREELGLQYRSVLSAAPTARS